MTPEDIKRLAQRFDVAPSTVHYWLNGRLPKTIGLMLETIVKLEKEVYWLKREPLT
jgi:transposase-like protein